MSVRFDASGDGYSATTGLPGTAFTALCWGRIAVDRNTYSTFFSVDNNSASQLLAIQTDVSGTGTYLWCQPHGAGFLAESPDVPGVVGSWQRMAVVRNGSAITFYLAGSGGGSTTGSFGKQTDGAFSTESTADKTAVSLFTATTTGTLTAGHARVWLSAAGTTNTRFVVYADSSGAPGTKLAESDVLAVTATTEGVRDYVFSGANRIAVTSGVKYWIGPAWQAPGGPSLVLSRDGTTDGRRETLSYAPDPFGAATSLTGPVDAYVDVASGADVISSASGTLTGALTPTRLRVGQSPTSGEWLDGNVANLKIYGAALTQAEIVTEWGNWQAQRTANLLRHHKWQTAAETTDHSGNGWVLTAAGSPTFEATNPSIGDSAPTPPVVTGPLRVGAGTVSALRVGTAPVLRAYRGATLVWGNLPGI